MTLTELLAVLAPVGVPVLPPGTPTGTLPALVVTPGDDELGDGNRSLIRRYDVTALVTRDTVVKRLVELDALEATVLTVLVAADGVTVESPIRFAESAPGQPASFARIIPVAFADASVNLCP